MQTKVNKKARRGPDNTVEKLDNYSCFFRLWLRNYEKMFRRSNSCEIIDSKKWICSTLL